MAATDLFSQVFSTIAQDAGTGANATGSVAAWLMNAGQDVATITKILNGVATSASASPQQVQYAQQELAWLNAQNQPKPTNWLIPALIIGGGLFLLSRKKS